METQYALLASSTKHEHVDAAELQKAPPQPVIDTPGMGSSMFAMSTPQSPLPTPYAVSSQPHAQPDDQSLFHPHGMVMSVPVQNGLPSQDHSGLPVLATNRQHPQHTLLSDAGAKGSYDQRLLTADTESYRRHDLVTPLPTPEGPISPQLQSDLIHAGTLQAPVGTAHALHLPPNVISSMVTQVTADHPLMSTEHIQRTDGMEYTMAYESNMTRKPMTAYQQQQEQITLGYPPLQQPQQPQHMVQNILFAQGDGSAMEHSTMSGNHAQPVDMSQMATHFGTSIAPSQHLPTQATDVAHHAGMHPMALAAQNFVPPVMNMNPSSMPSNRLGDHAPGNQLLGAQPEAVAMIHDMQGGATGGMPQSTPAQQPQPSKQQQPSSEIIFINENMETQRHGSSSVQRDHGQPKAANMSHMESVTKTSLSNDPKQQPPAPVATSNELKRKSVSDSTAVSAKDFESMSREQLIARLMKLERMKRNGSLQGKEQRPMREACDVNMTDVALEKDGAETATIGDEDEDRSPSPVDLQGQYASIEDKETDQDEDDYDDEAESEQPDQEPIVVQVPMRCQWKDCGDMCSDMQTLITHIADNHVGSGKPTYRCEWEGCPRNQKPFTKRHKLYNHLRTHTGERPYVCSKPGCGKRFSRPDSLTTHIKTHSNIRPFRCEVPGCNKAYYHSRSLKKHSRTHDGEVHATATLITTTAAAAAAVAVSTVSAPLITPNSLEAQGNPQGFHFSSSNPMDFATSDASMAVLQSNLVDPQSQAMTSMFDSTMAVQGTAVGQLSHPHTSSLPSSSIHSITYHLSTAPTAIPGLLEDYKINNQEQTNMAHFSDGTTVANSQQNYIAYGVPVSMPNDPMNRKQ